MAKKSGSKAKGEVAKGAEKSGSGNPRVQSPKGVKGGGPGGSFGGQP